MVIFKIEAVRINDHFKKDDKTFTASSRQVNEEDRSILYNKLGNCPMKWLLGPEPTFSGRKNVFEPSNIEDLLEIFMEDFQEACRVTTDQINWLAANTKDQRGSLLWGRLRRLRLTGSNFGMVIAAFDRNLRGMPYPIVL